jgi:hypothetical protein
LSGSRRPGPWRPCADVPLGRPASLHISRNQFVNPAGVNGLPFEVVRNVRWPDGAASKRVVGPARLEPATSGYERLKNSTRLTEDPSLKPARLTHFLRPRFRSAAIHSRLRTQRRILDLLRVEADFLQGSGKSISARQQNPEPNGLASPFLPGFPLPCCNMAVVRRRMASARDGRSGCLRRHSSRRSKNSSVRRPRRRSEQAGHDHRHLSGDQPAGNRFTTVRMAGILEVLRGVSFTPGTAASH